MFHAFKFSLSCRRPLLPSLHQNQIIIKLLILITSPTNNLEAIHTIAYPKSSINLESLVISEHKMTPSSI